MQKTKTCLVQLILFFIILGVGAAVVQRFVLRPGGQEGQAKSALASLKELLPGKEEQGQAQSAQVASALPTMPIPEGGYIEGLRLKTSRPLMFAVAQPRGLAWNGDHFYISAQDAKSKEGVIYQVRQDRYTIVQMHTYKAEGRRQIGGIDLGTERLWAPLSGEGADATSVILGIDPITLEVKQRFEVADRIAAVVETPDGELVGANADGTLYYRWTREGVERQRTASTQGVVPGDMTPVRDSLVCGGTLQELGSGALDVLDPATLTLLRRHNAGTLSERSAVPTAGGLATHNGEFLLLPQGGENPKIMVYELEGSETLDQYVPSVAQ
jgi:hypothetical protein